MTRSLELRPEDRVVVQEPTYEFPRDVMIEAGPDGVTIQTLEMRELPKTAPERKTLPQSLARHPCVIMDIDGTLANAEHRIHLLPKNRHDGVAPDQAWREFYEAAANDDPNEEIVALSNAMSHTYPIMVCTGRSDRDREMTVTWLHNAQVSYSWLIMRDDGDHRPDTQVKRDMLEALRALGFEPIFAVEDRAGVTKMWREAGLRCLQVCEGDY